MKTETTHTPTTQNTRKNKCRVNKENHDWKEDYITIFQQQRLEKLKLKRKI